jgi:hypothetical protein
MEMMMLADDDPPHLYPHKGRNKPNIFVIDVRRRCLPSHYGRNSPFKLQ